VYLYTSSYFKSITRETRSKPLDPFPWHLRHRSTIQKRYGHYELQSLTLPTGTRAILLVWLPNQATRRKATGTYPLCDGSTAKSAHRALMTLKRQRSEASCTKYANGTSKAARSRAERRDFATPNKLNLDMPRKKSKSEKTVTDRTRPWSERIAAARTAVDQIPAADWKHGVLAAFLREVETELGDHQPSPEYASSGSAE